MSMSDDKDKTNPKDKSSALKAKQLEGMMDQEDREAAKAFISTEKESSEITFQVLAQHTVVSGDTLSGIAQEYYGSQANWRAIYDANKGIIGDNPNLISIGQVFKIPKLD